jgi:hypothetical protein
MDGFHFLCFWDRLRPAFIAAAPVVHLSVGPGFVVLYSIESRPSQAVRKLRLRSALVCPTSSIGRIPRSSAIRICNDLV